MTMTETRNEGFDAVKTRVHMSVSGSGQPLFLLHSLLSDKASFDVVAPRLAKSFQVFIPELPGFGQSQQVAGDLDAVADRMAEAVADASEGRKAILIGNGYGSFIALLVAIRHPHLVDRLVLAGGGVSFSEPGRQAFRNMRNAAAAKGLEAITDIAMGRLFVPEFQQAHPDLMVDRRKAFLATPPSVFADACTALSELDLRKDVGKLMTPTLIVVGDQDAATPPEMARELAALLPNAELKILPQCAHVPQLQAPEAFIEAVSDFLRLR